MDRNENIGPQYPPRIRAAFNYLGYARMITWQIDAAIPTRDLTPLEKSVETAALRAVQMYLLGEMDFRDDAAPDCNAKKDADDRRAESADKKAD